MTPEQALEESLRQGNIGKARQIAIAILQRNPKNKTALQALAHVALIIGVSGEALTIATRAIEQDEHDPRSNLLLAEIHGARGHTETALGYCDRVLKKNPANATAIQVGARLLERAGMWKEATALLEPLSSLQPKPHLLALTLARCWMHAGRYDDAIGLLDESVANSRGVSPAARKQRNSLIGLKARILDRMGRFDEAWGAATEANDLLQIQYKPQAYTDEVDALIAWFSSERLAQLPRAEKTASRHVFIVGLPRSGTTLTEQILDAHRDVTGLGEIKDLDVLVRMLPKSLQIREPLPDIFQYADATRLGRMVENYEKAIKEQGFAQAPVYVNKNLRNPFLLGYIALMFPGAKVVVCSRDLRDTGVSSFMAGMNHEMFPYLFNTEHMAAAMRDYQRLIQHWREVLPLQFLELQYEDLISDQETQTRRLLDFCELEWDAQCLKFWESDRTVMTQSYDQVTRPMYDASVARYKNYASHIEPLMALVDD